MQINQWLQFNNFLPTIINTIAEANEISIAPKAVRLHWPVLPYCWRSVELAEIPIEMCTVGALTALPDYLLILLAISNAACKHNTLSVKKSI